MAGSINRAIIVGRLGRDPEGRKVRDNDIANLSIATSERWRNKSTGEMEERTEWHRVAIFNERLAGIAIQHLAKGDQVGVEGKIQTRKWQDQSGADRYSTEIVVDRFNGELYLLGNGGERRDAGEVVQRTAQSMQAPQHDDLDSEIPF